jgi:hypothetical protein
LVQMFLPALVAGASFYLLECFVAVRAYLNARRTGSAGLGKTARRFWAFAGITLLTVLGIHASIVVHYHREVQLKRVREHEQLHPGDRGPRVALLRKVRTEMYIGGAALAAMAIAGMFWRGVTHEDGWVGPDKLGPTARV